MRRRSGAGWAVLILIAAAAGCSTERAGEGWNLQKYRSDSGALVSAAAAVDLGYTPRWSTDVDLGSRQNIEFATILDDLLVVVSRPDSLVAALSMRDGSIRWIKKIGSHLEPLYTPIRWEGNLYINSGYRFFEVDPYSGEILTVAPLSDPVTSGPTLLDDKAVFGSVNGKVFAHSLVTGRTRWAYLMPAQVEVPPVVVGQNIFATDFKGTYAMLMGSTGRMLWTGRTFGPITVPPAVDRTSIYIASNDNFLYAINRATNEDKWKYAAGEPLRQAPAAIGLGVYQPVRNRLIALDAVDGREPRWTLDEPARPVLARGDQLIVLSDKGFMIVEVDTGRIVRKIATRPIRTALVGPEDSLILIAADGKVMRIDPS